MRRQRKGKRRSSGAKVSSTRKLESNQQNVSKNNLVIMPGSKRTPALSTAALVVKGAVSAALGVAPGRTTIGTHYSEGGRARLTVALGSKYAECPTEEALATLARAALAKVAENAPVHIVEMERSAAEKAYGDAMYDKANVPDSVTTLKIAFIKGWAFNCTPSEHVASTGLVGELSMTKTKWRKAKKELEIQFEIKPPAEGAEGGRNPPCDIPSGEEIAKLGKELYVDAAPAAEKSGQIITPWTVQGDDGGVDYDKVVKDFGSSLIDDALIARFERVTGKRAHHWLRRGMFYSHRDLDKILDL